MARGFTLLLSLAAEFPCTVAHPVISCVYSKGISLMKLRIINLNSGVDNEKIEFD